MVGTSYEEKDYSLFFFSSPKISCPSYLCRWMKIDLNRDGASAIVCISIWNLQSMLRNATPVYTCTVTDTNYNL